MLGFRVWLSLYSNLAICFNTITFKRSIPISCCCYITVISLFQEIEKYGFQKIIFQSKISFSDLANSAMLLLSFSGDGFHPIFSRDRFRSHNMVIPCHLYAISVSIAQIWLPASGYCYLYAISITSCYLYA